VDLTGLPWRKSSYSGSESACVELAFLPWRKSSYSGTETNCVELADGTEHIAVRDSKNPDGGVLVFPRPALDTLLFRFRSS
jgi:Domain of unknown function (DUF397)